ncbi:hypothetical protein G6F62_014965 [Rhizopus arrhizus]|nr:hypothetical protein G6F62_014965 [Rhizopus arrhizus]
MRRSSKPPGLSGKKSSANTWRLTALPAASINATRKVRSWALRCKEAPAGATRIHPPSCKDQVLSADARVSASAGRGALARRMRRARLRMTELSSSRSTGLVM